MAIRVIVETLTLTRPIGPQTEAQAQAEAKVSAAIAASCERIAGRSLLDNPLDRAVFRRGWSAIPAGPNIMNGR
jgi:hypothetical protein